MKGKKAEKYEWKDKAAEIWIEMLMQLDMPALFSKHFDRR